MGHEKPATTNLELALQLERMEAKIDRNAEKIATMTEFVKNIDNNVASLSKEMDRKANVGEVARPEELEQVKKIVFGAVGLLLTGVGVAFVEFVVRGGLN